MKIVAGIIASLSVQVLGSYGPFNVAMVILVIGSIIIIIFWTENYGESRGGITTSLSPAVSSILLDGRIFKLGIIQCCFESSMYIFVFLWTPTIENLAEDEILHGWIFAGFMVSITIGSSLYVLLCRNLEFSRVIFKGKIIFGSAGCAFLIASFASVRNVHFLIDFCSKLIFSLRISRFLA